MTRLSRLLILYGSQTGQGNDAIDKNVRMLIVLIFVVVQRNQLHMKYLTGALLNWTYLITELRLQSILSNRSVVNLILKRNQQLFLLSQQLARVRT